jgi:hypothetical protein
LRSVRCRSWNGWSSGSPAVTSSSVGWIASA